MNAITTPRVAAWPRLEAPEQGFYFATPQEAHNAYEPRMTEVEEAREVLRAAYVLVSSLIPGASPLMRRELAAVANGLVDLDADTTRHLLERQAEARDWLSDTAHVRTLANALGCYTMLRPDGGHGEAARVAALMAVPR
jgi:hypothetical protein